MYIKTEIALQILLKVLSYWNLNQGREEIEKVTKELKVLSYWNLNFIELFVVDAP